MCSSLSENGAAGPRGRGEIHVLSPLPSRREHETSARASVSQRLWAAPRAGSAGRTQGTQGAVPTCLPSPSPGRSPVPTCEHWPEKVRAGGGQVVYLLQKWEPLFPGLGMSGFDNNIPKYFRYFKNVLKWKGEAFGFS